MRVHVEKKTGEIEKDFRFELNADFFSANFGTSLGFLRLQGSHKTGRQFYFNLIYMNWNEEKRCTVKVKRIEDVSWENQVNVNLMIWISTTGQLNVMMDGEKMEIHCKNNIWSKVNRVKVTLLDMKLENRNTDKLLNIYYEIDHYQAIGKFWGRGGK